MSFRTSLSLVGSALRIGGLGAPHLLNRYGQLWRLHHRPRRPIARLPRRKRAASSESVPASASFVVPIYNNFEDTRTLLSQLREEARPEDRILLVNDCSTDARLAPLLKSYAQSGGNVRLLENTENLGFVQTCNRGMAEAEGDLVILNTDIELPPGGLARLLRTLRSADGIASVTPLSNSAYGTGIPDPIRHNDRPFGATTADIDASFQSLGDLEPLEIPRGVGFCMAISGRALAALGPFSEDFGAGYGEEADFCLRARKAGFRNVVAPDIYVCHKAGQSFGGSWRQKARRGQMLLLDRHPDYPAMMADYLNRGEIDAIACAGLAALARQLSEAERSPLASHDGSVDAMLFGSPTYFVTERSGRAEVRITYRRESHLFTFERLDLARQALELAGIAGIEMA